MKVANFKNPIHLPAFDFGDDYSVLHESPTVHEFLHFRKITGLGDKDPEAVARSLAQSAFTTKILHKGRCVGFCRMLSDGGHWYYIADGIILPEYQAVGLGKYIVSSIAHAFYEMAPAGAYIYAVTHAPEFGVKSGMMYTPPEIRGFYSWLPMFQSERARPQLEIPAVHLKNSETYQISKSVPEESAFHQLREKMSLPAKDKATTKISFQNTPFAIKIEDRGKLVGFARILGDGGVWCFGGDLLVDPAYDRHIMATFMLYELNKMFHESASPGAYLLIYTSRPEEATESGFIPLPDREVPLYGEQPYPLK